MSEKLISPKLTHNASVILKDRYLLKDEHGDMVETELQMFQRVAHFVASAEEKYGTNREEIEESFLQSMLSLDFLPNSPTLMNAGTSLGQLAACFVLPIDDSVESVYKAVEHSARIQASGGGVGFSFSRIRPQGDSVRSTGGIAAGPIPFLQVFDATTQSIKQSGVRRGANMGVLSIDHPDIEKFISAKADATSLINFNISVAVTDQFIDSVIKDEEFKLVNPRTNEIVRAIDAKSLFDMIVEMAWATGDPGMLFLDRINRDNPTPHLGEIEGTNPCGETPLLPYESCVLGSVNLSNMILDGKINWGKLTKTISLGVRFLDDIIDVNKHPLPEVEQMALANRKIGLGIMGWADVLIKLGIPYDSEEGICVAEEVMEFVSFHARMASIQLAKERGRFPEYKDILREIYLRNLDFDTVRSNVILRDRPKLEWDSLITELKEYGIRNATVTTIAPTGTISTIAGTASGIEPLFAIAYTRKIMEQELHEVNDLFQKAAKHHGFDSAAVMEEIIEKGSAKNLKMIPESIRRIFVTAHDIAPEWHVRMQAAFQKYVDNAVSKTVNMRNDASTADVADVYLLAHRLGCKGITVYRDGCRKQQVLSGGIPAETHYVPKMRPVPPGIQNAWRQSLDTPTGKMTLFITETDGKPFDAFVILGRSGSDITAFTEAIGRLLSIALRSNIPVDILAENLRGLGGRTSIGFGTNRVLSVPDAIGQLLQQKYCSPPNSHQPGEICPECKNASLEYGEGCLKCPLCGFSQC